MTHENYLFPGDGVRGFNKVLALEYQLYLDGTLSFVKYRSKRRLVTGKFG
jgi:hypothetical protein